MEIHKIVDMVSAQMMLLFNVLTFQLEQSFCVKEK